jgi:hypothetical protein
MFHDHKTAGCPGELKTYNLVAKVQTLLPWWPGLQTFVKKYVSNLPTVQN